MKFNLENNALTIYLEGQFNSYNAESVEKEINDIIEGKNFTSLNLDFDNLKYISSAGLRIIMSLRQRYNDITLKNVHDDINDIFVMVGFETIIKIERK